jgi:tetratricopeptide (TPR) repeat protein
VRAALESLAGTEAPAEIAELQGTLGAILYLSAGDPDEVADLLESALTLAQHHEVTEQLADTLYLKGLLLASRGREIEARALFEASLSAARRYGMIRSEMSVEAMLADHLMTRDLPGAEDHARASLALARRYGLRGFEAGASGNLMYILTMAGRPAEAERLGTEMLEVAADERSVAAIQLKLADIELLRGNIAESRERILATRAVAEGDDAQFGPMHSAAEAALSLAEGRSRQALETARGAIEAALSAGVGIAHEAVRAAYAVALHSAVSCGDLEEADRLAESLTARPQGEVPPFLRAQVVYARALVARARDDEELAQASLVAAEEMFGDLGYPYWIARVQLDQAEWLARNDRLDESDGLARTAAAVFEACGSAPMLERARALLVPTVAA